MIAAGSLDRRISIQQCNITRDAMGAAKESFTTQYANVPAMFKALTGREKYKVESAREIGYFQARFTIRYIAGLTKKHRILFEGEYYDILNISEMVRRQGQEILAQKAV